ncbi:MAG TPA: universal stress protein [Chloroflexota bacterium]|nr:universal stress protein [Chloroflexota bacterium]
MGAKVLVPLDGSEVAAVAVGYAEQVATTLGWGVVLFSVVERGTERPRSVPITPANEPSPAAWEQWARQLGINAAALRQEMTAVLASMAAAADHLRAAGRPVEAEIGVGQPPNLIVERAAADDIAMIVMASHGRTGLAHLLRGSVASGVVERSPRAILLVCPFRAPERRLDLEHADRLPPDQAEAVRGALRSIAG